MRRSRPAKRIVLAFVLLTTAAVAAKGDEVGVSADAILFGQAAVLEGPSSALGQRMRQGIVAAFTAINAMGGVHGRKLQLVSRDDGTTFYFTFPVVGAVQSTLEGEAA